MVHCKSAQTGLCAALVMACAQPEYQVSTFDSVLVAQISEYVSPHVEDGNFTGSIAVSQGDRLLAALGFGAVGPEAAEMNTPATRHHIASLSKALTATAIMVLVDDGLVSPDDPLANFIPSFPNSDVITLHDLLTHTSGIPDINRFADYQELSTQPQTLDHLVSVIARESAAATPTGYRYSNSNYNLLAHVIENVSGMAYGEFMTERVFEPLGMAATAHSGSIVDKSLPSPAQGQIPVGMVGVGEAPYLDWSIKTGNGSIVSTVGDLSRFLQRLYDQPLLTESSRDLMLRPHVDDRYAYGWFVGERFGRRVVYGNGNTPGVSASQEFYPDDGIAIVVLANHDIALASRMSRDIAAMVFDSAVAMPERLPRFQPVGGIRTAGFIGRYDFGIGFDISNDNGALIARGAWPRYPVTLIPIGEDLFFHRFWTNELRFERGEDGAVIALRWNGRTAQREGGR